MIEMSLADVAAVTGGVLADADPDATVSGPVEYDSRRVADGGLFVAFPGARVDGHDYAAAAVAQGAAAVLGTRQVDGVPMVLVADAHAALGALARAVADRLSAPPDGALTVLGVTGSSGKTTTKDMLAQLTTERGPTVAPAGSLNNELGHPYTVLRADADTRYLVLEKAARGLGHIRHLCGIAPPHLAVVLNVGAAHIGEFGSMAAVARAKTELVEGLRPDGVAILNADDPYVAAMADRAPGRVVRYGESDAADVRAVDVALDDRGRPGYRLVAAGATADVHLSLTGAHQVANTLAVAAVGLELGMTVPEVASVLGALRAVSARRMEVVELPDGTIVIDDSYNANPSSTAAALRALRATAAGRRTVAVLGYLAELGEHEQEEHRRVGALAAELGVDRVVAVGEQAAPVHDGAAAAAGAGWAGESTVVADQDAAVAWLRDHLRPGDVVLVKGSRYQTWDVADWLRASGTGGESGTTAATAAGVGRG